MADMEGGGAYGATQPTSVVTSYRDDVPTTPAVASKSVSDSESGRASVGLVSSVLALVGGAAVLGMNAVYVSSSSRAASSLLSHEADYGAEQVRSSLL